MSVPPRSWQAFSPIRFRGNGSLKTIIPEMTRRARLQKSLAGFRSRLSSLCPHQTIGNQTRQLVGKKSFPTSRSASLDFQPQIISLPLHILCTFRSSWLTPTFSYDGRLYSGLVIRLTHPRRIHLLAMARFYIGNRINPDMSTQ
jgi:hypothetical protein